LCQRGVFLENGELKKVGKASDVVATYIGLVHEDMNQELTQQIEISETKIDNNLNASNLAPSPEIINISIPSKIFVSVDKAMEMAEGSHRYGDGGAKILDIKLLNSNHISTDLLDFKEDFTIQVSIHFDKDLPSFCLGYSLRDLKGQMLIGSISTIERIQLPSVKKQDIYIAEIKAKNILKPGIYTITVGVELPVLLNQQHIFLDIVEDAVVFSSNIPSNILDYMPFMVYAPGKMKLFKLNNLINLPKNLV
jgi:lipopolysaccharide transport system ATP-binding protein